MTLAPHTDRLRFETIDDAIEALRERGLRLSMTRQLVLEALFAARGPLAADDIARRLELVETSVYRNLELLERNGLVRHVHLGHSAGLYALVGRSEHEYIYCPGCGGARAVRPELLDPVREHVRSRFGYEVNFTHFALVGRCPQCVQADAA
jgi:Fur family transcriptional regulator, ferric uptake regulator